MAKFISAFLIVLLLVLGGCSSHERDNRFDRNGVAYNPSAEVDRAELASGAGIFFKFSLFSCSRSCLESLGFSVQFLLDLFKIMDELFEHLGLAKTASPPPMGAVAISFDLPSLPDTPTLPDYTDNIDSYYRDLKSISASQAIAALNMPHIDATQYKVDSIPTLSDAKLIARIHAMDFGDLREIGNALEEAFQTAETTTLQSSEYKALIQKHIDSLQIPTDTLVSLINSDTCALTLYLWKEHGDSLKAQTTALLLENLSQSKASLLWITLLQMYSDLHAAMDPVQAKILPKFLLKGTLPSITTDYRTLSEEFVAATLRQLVVQMALIEINAKQNSTDSPTDIAKFFAKYRGVYNNNY